MTPAPLTPEERKEAVERAAEWRDSTGTWTGESLGWVVPRSSVDELLNLLDSFAAALAAVEQERDEFARKFTLAEEDARIAERRAGELQAQLAERSSKSSRAAALREVGKP